MIFLLNLYSPQASWEAARLTCACSNAGELVSITSAEEDALVNSTAGETENTWIGAHDIGAENTFEWSDGTAWGYTNWRENHPNNGGTDGNQVRRSSGGILSEFCNLGLCVDDHSWCVG